MTGPAALMICDLGGVAVRIDPQRCVDRLSRFCRSSPAVIERRLFDDPVHEAFERGEISADRYLSWVGHALDLRCEADEISGCFNDVLLGPNEAVLSVLGRARERGTRVVALSNTNELHRDAWWGRWKRELALFDRLYLSFEIGARKPEPRAFELVLDGEEMSAAEAVFVDDMPEYVEAAERLGIRGILYRTPQQLESDLQVPLG